MNLFHLEQERRKEAERRFLMLGDYATADYTSNQLLVLARQRYIPRSVLISWKHAFLRAGLDGLLPQEWKPLSELSQQKIAKRLELVKDLTDILTIDEKALQRVEQR